jgi:branched-chain amino acid transport system substrate-binding protein
LPILAAADPNATDRAIGRIASIRRARIVREKKNKVFVATGPGTSALTGEQCSSNCLHWAYDTYMLARLAGSAATAAGGDSCCFFITADYAFRHQLEKETSWFIQQAGGARAG